MVFIYNNVVYLKWTIILKLTVEVCSGCWDGAAGVCKKDAPYDAATGLCVAPPIRVLNINEIFMMHLKLTIDLK